MSPLSPIPPTQGVHLSHSHPQSHVDSGSSNNPQASLRRAHYVKVIDLALSNKLDVVKIKEETAKKKEELRLGACSVKDDELSKTNSQDDYSLQSGSGPKHRYQKRIVPSTGGFNLCL